MKCLIFAIGLILLLSPFSFAQKKAKAKPRSAPAKTVAKPTIDMGTVSGRTYTNKMLGFEVTFPLSWLIPDSDFEAYMKKQGYDLSLKAPDSLPMPSKAAVNKALKQVTVLLTAYRSMPGSADNAIVRISAEDLKQNPQIKNAADYLDAIRTMYKSLKPPPDFTYSDTEAETLGGHQFGYLDVSSDAGKRRMYVSVRNGFAVLLTLSYSQFDDLDTFRRVLDNGNFFLK